MYLNYFGLKFSPFSLTPDTRLFCATRTHVEAFQLLKFALQEGEGFIKITGEVGTGKTMLCRLLLNHIHGKQAYAYIANPALSPFELKTQVARELNLNVNNTQESQLNGMIERQLLALNRAGKPVVLIIDEAQAMPEASMETLRLFSNLETEKTKLLQIVLFGQPELDQNLAQKHWRQLRQRISFSHQLKRLSSRQIHAYINQRLSRAGYVGSPVFTSLQVAVLRFFSGGAPRVVNIIAHKCLLLTFVSKRRRVSWHSLMTAAKDTEGARAVFTRLWQGIAAVLALTSAGAAVAMWGWL